MRTAGIAAAVYVALGTLRFLGRAVVEAKAARIELETYTQMMGAWAEDTREAVTHVGLAS